MENTALCSGSRKYIINFLRHFMPYSTKFCVLIKQQAKRQIFKLHRTEREDNMPRSSSSTHPWSKRILLSEYQSSNEKYFRRFRRSGNDLFAGELLKREPRGAVRAAVCRRSISADHISSERRSSETSIHRRCRRRRRRRWRRRCASGCLISR